MNSKIAYNGMNTIDPDCTLFAFNYGTTVANNNNNNNNNLSQ